jgi:hypothetical protein
VLPFEHQGAGRDYDDGNFLAYLPQDAGGGGHIMYVRDSDEEDEPPDDDEDPDDDIDL